MTEITYIQTRNVFSGPLFRSLADVLVLVPTYRGGHPLFNHCIEQLAMAGAVVLKSSGISDIALHRNLMAGMGLAFLKEHDASKFVVWLDDDMVFSVEDIAALRWFCMQGKSAVSASYCKRGKQSELTWGKAFTNCRPKYVALPDGCEVECYPVVAGMGAMMLARDDFAKVCADAVQFGKVEANDVQSFPAVCWTTAMQNVKGEYEWVSEDKAYSSFLWSVLPGGLWGVPVAVGHVSELPLLPTADAVWL